MADGHRSRDDSLRMKRRFFKGIRAGQPTRMDQRRAYVRRQI